MAGVLVNASASYRTIGAVHAFVHSDVVSQVCLVLSCLVLFCLVLSCFVLFCLVLFCLVLFCLVLFCFVLSCFALFCFVLFCLVLSCFALFCLVLFCFVLSCFAFFAVLFYQIVADLIYCKFMRWVLLNDCEGVIQNVLFFSTIGNELYSLNESIKSPV